MTKDIILWICAQHFFMAIPTVSFDFSVATETVVFFWRGGGFV